MDGARLFRDGGGVRAGILGVYDGILRGLRDESRSGQ